MVNSSKNNLSFMQTYTLVAQTPMIHFQYAQPGATLRATEVKPKLDKYIVKMLGGESNVDKKWFIKGTEALNYKMRFQASGVPKISRNCEDACRSVDESAREGRIRIRNGGTINGMYFANMVSTGNKTAEQVKQDICDNYKETVFYEEPIKMTVTCFIPELLDAITNSIQSFFVLHNFGTRQSKGFGGFIVSEINGVKCDNSHKTVCEILSGYKYFYADCGTTDTKALMNHALTVYAILKGGLNMTGWDDRTGSYRSPDSYIKSYIQRSFLDEVYGSDFGSEKSKIKTKKNPAVPVDRNRKEHVQNYKGYYFIRALLGLADHYEFRGLRKGNVNIYSLGESGFNIERFKSPITVKVIDKNIYFVFDVETMSIMTNQTFYLLDNEPKWLKGKAYPEKKKFITENGWAIKTPERFGEEAVEKLIKGFVEYFCKERYKLSKFKPPFNVSKNLVLMEGQ